MKNNYNGKKNHVVIGWIAEIALCIVMISICFAFAIMTLSGPNYTPEEIRAIATDITEIESNIGNPEDWHILEINEDYSEALVLVANGEIHFYTVYSANDETVQIAHNGELYSFYIPAP